MNRENQVNPGADPKAVDAEIERQLAEAMDGQDMEQLLAAAEPASDASDPQQPPQDQAGGSTPATVVRGRIATIHGDDVFVNLQGTDGKNQGVVPLTQFDRPPRIGSVMDFVVQRLDPSQGLIFLLREGAVGRATWDLLARGNVVEARVTAQNKGGLELEIVGGIKAFMPASSVDLHYVEDLEQFVGQKLQAEVQEINRRGKKVVLNRRSLLETRRKAKQAQLWKELEVGQTRQGVITSVTHFGVFVDIGGVDGLVHVSDMSYSRVERPSEVAKVGQAVTVQVLKIESDSQRISLGIKQAEPDPWQGVEQRVRIGDCLSARVVRTTDFGAFVEVEPGIEGLVPVSELSWKYVDKPSQVVQDGDVVRVMILRIEPDAHRISLSIKQAKGDPWRDIEQRYETGSLVEATVSKITDFGAFVELEQGVEGLVHISELSHGRVDRVQDALQPGEKKQFRILGVDSAQRRIRLSLKAVDRPSQTTDRSGSTPTKAHKKPRQSLKGGLE